MCWLINKAPSLLTDQLPKEVGTEDKLGVYMDKPKPRPNRNAPIMIWEKGQLVEFKPDPRLEELRAAFADKQHKGAMATTSSKKVLPRNRVIRL